MDIHEVFVLLQDILRLDEGDPTLMILDCDLSPGCNDGDNYMSTITRVQVRGTRHGDKQEAFKRSIVLKRQPDSEVYRTLFKCGLLFLNERATYFEVLPAFQRFNKISRRLPYPKCLYATEDIIVLEDLQPEGYKMYDRLKGLDFNHCKLVFEELASLHAISLAMKREDPDKFKIIRSSIQETTFKSNNKSLLSPSLENAFKIALFSLREMSITDPSLLGPIKSLEGINKNLFHTMSNLVKPREPFAVINHGDCWINNFLFKYREDGQVENVKMLDLQATRYSSPAIDILHFLYTSTHDDVRKHHFDALLSIYHKTVIETLRRLVHDTQVESIFTIDQLKYEMRVNALYGLINGLWLMPAVTVDSTTMPNLRELVKDDLYCQENMEHWIAHQTQAYQDRIRSLVLEYIERGFLK